MRSAVARLIGLTLPVAALLIAGCARLTASPTESAPPAESPADRALATRVREALLADARLRGSQIDVQARNGEVKLRGTAPTFRERRRAVEAALRVLGVRRVTSEIETTQP